VRVTPTSIDGAYVVELSTHEDARGSFSRAWCKREFEEAGLPVGIAQINISHSPFAGTLRGLHYQADPHAEAKVVRCLRGAIYDVALDIRAGSPTFGRWEAVELNARDRRSFYIPEGCAHGLQTLVDDVDVLYIMSAEYVESAARVVRWNDERFAIDWPAARERIISDRDATAPNFPSSVG